MSKKNEDFVTEIYGKGEKIAFKKFKPRGVDTPKVFVNCIGFFDANIWRDVCVDDETGDVSSKYTARQMANYKNYCKRMVSALGTSLTPARIKAEQLIKEDVGICDEMKKSTCREDATARECEYTSKKVGTLHNRHAEILSKLIEIEKLIKTHEYALRKELEAVAEEYKACFAAYGHGMHRKTVSVEKFPEMSYAHAFDDYEQTYKEDDVILANYIKEGKNYV